jgi:hypothetical protein
MKNSPGEKLTSMWELHLGIKQAGAYLLRIWIDFCEDDMSPWVLSSIHIQQYLPNIQSTECSRHKAHLLTLNIAEVQIIAYKTPETETCKRLLKICLTSHLMNLCKYDI